MLGDISFVEPAPSTAAICSYSEETVTDEAMEVDEEYLEFRRITLEHRKKRGQYSRFD